MKAVRINTERLRKCRENLGLSKNSAAKMLNVSQPTYLRYESGERVPSDQMVKEIALRFGTSIEYLTDQSNMSAPTSYQIEQDRDPALFELIKMSKDLDTKQLDRLLSYVRKL